MSRFEDFIKKLNFKKATIFFILTSGILLLICLSSIAYVSRDKIAMIMEYERISDIFAKEGVTDRLETQLQKLAADSKDIRNVIILDKDNMVVFKTSDNLIEDKRKLELTPYGVRSGYLQDNFDHLYKVVKPENMILNKDYIQKDQQVRQAIEEELSYETDFTSKEVYLLNYLIERSNQSKVLMIRTANPIPYAEKLLEITGALIGLFMAIYWIGLALWVYKDAGRKKLNAALWGLLIIITNLVGLVVYLIYKQNNLTCYKCGALQSKFNSFCSHCGTEINIVCHQCKARINKGDCYCSRCGGKVD